MILLFTKIPTFYMFRWNFMQSFFFLKKKKNFKYTYNYLFSSLRASSRAWALSPSLPLPPPPNPEPRPESLLAGYLFSAFVGLTNANSDRYKAPIVTSGSYKFYQRTKLAGRRRIDFGYFGSYWTFFIANSYSSHRS